METIASAPPAHAAPGGMPDSAVQAPEPFERALDALMALGERLGATTDRDTIARVTLDTLLAIIPAPVAIMRLLNREAALLEPLDTRGWPVHERPLRAIGLEEGVLGSIMQLGEPTVVPDIAEAAESRPLRRSDTPRTLLVVPLRRDDDALGCVTLARSLGTPFSAVECRFAAAVALQAASALDHAAQLRHTRNLYLASIQSLAAAVDARDTYTHRHSRNVADYARRAAQELGLPPCEIETIELAALLHDIGKIGIADAILGKRGKLSTAELSIMATHPTQGAAILAANDALAPLVPLVRHHHEWWNGAGYPDGLAGAQIPLGAAIISVADAFDTMTTDRAYRRARSFASACAELEREAGRQFHPEVAAAFLRTLQRDMRDGAEYTARLARLETSMLQLPGPRTLAAERQELVAGQIRPQQLKELAVLHHLARTIGTLTDLDRFLAGALQVIAREFGEHGCALLLNDERDQTLTVRAVSGFDRAVIGRSVPLRAGSIPLLPDHGARRIPDIAREPDYTPWAPASRAALLVPLISAGETLGAICVEARAPGVFNADDELTLETIANQLAVAVAVARLHDREKRAAITDGLTGVYNHRHFYQCLEVALEQARRDRRPLAVVILDMNGLKAINDTHGHRAGDAALRLVANLLTACARPEDTIARYGGDEFAILLESGGAGEAVALVERLRARLAASAVTSDGEAIGSLTFASGAAFYPVDGQRAAALVAAADTRMYGQKRATRPGARDTGSRLQARAIISQLPRA